MTNIVLLSALIVLKVLGLALIIRERRRLRRTVATSEVCRQYVYLFRGGHLSESALQTARVALEPMLQRGEVGRVEAGLRPGKQFTAQVRALAEIGTESARGILERQLERPLGVDPLEQSWYRLDLARCLRQLN